MTTYRNAIKQAFDRRMGVNPRYSLRAFARDLGLSAGFLSQILKSQRGLTLGKAEEIFSKLGFTPSEQKLYLLEVQKEARRSTVKKAQVQKQIDSAVQQVGSYTFKPEEFDRMSQWYVMALLQLMRMKGPQGKKKWCEWAAKKLNISDELTMATLDSLIEMQMVKDEKGVFSAIHDTVWTTNQVSSGAIRTFHSQMIEKAKTAIEMQTIQERFLQSVQMPVMKSDLPQIQNDIVKFRNQLLRKYGRTSDKDEADTVYGLNLQLFKLLQD